MRHAIWVVLFSVSLLSAAQADARRGAFNTIRNLEQSDPIAAFSQMLTLAQGGYTPAKDRVGYYYRHGIGTGADLTAARRWLGQAASEGHPWSHASLARVELALGHRAEALDLLRAAAKADHPGVRLLLATAHIDRAFDEASEPTRGRQMLVDLARNGDDTAARALVLRHNWKRLAGHAPDDVVAQVVTRGRAGEAKFAEAALVYLTRLNDKSPAVTQHRAALLRVPGLRHHVASTERIRLAADLRPDRFWTAVEEGLNTTDPASYARVASTAFWINKNAWVRVLQKELRALGYYSGGINARMTQATIRAQNRFCRDTSIWPTCASGPLRGATVRAVAAKIAEHKVPPQ